MIGIFKVCYEKVLDLSEEEAKKLDDFMEEHFELFGDHVREARFCVPEDFEEELEPEDVHGNEKIIEILRKLQGSDVVVDW